MRLGRYKSPKRAISGEQRTFAVFAILPLVGDDGYWHWLEFVKRTYTYYAGDYGHEWSFDCPKENT